MRAKDSIADKNTDKVSKFLPTPILAEGTSLLRFRQEGKVSIVSVI